MGEPNYYDLLGVDPQASREEIWRAYRRMQGEWAADEAKRTSLNMAWSVLGDRTLRQEYDKRRAKQGKSTAGVSGTKGPDRPVRDDRTIILGGGDNRTTVISPARAFASLAVMIPGKETRVVLISSPVTAIGRGSKSTIVLPDDRHISRKHAEVRLKEGRYYIADSNSKNGTALNGQALPPGEERELKDGDEINIEGLMLKFQYQR